MRRASFLSLGFTLALLLLPARPATADPVAITVGFIEVSGVQDVMARGFLRSIEYDFEVDDLRLAAFDADFVHQDVFAPRLPRTSWWIKDGGTEEVVFLNLAQLAFTATPGVMPSEFTMTGWLTVVDLAGATLFDQAISGYGTATWQFVTTPTGGQLVSGVNYEFAPTPEPTSLLLLGSGLAALGARRWRTRRSGAGTEAEKFEL